MPRPLRARRAPHQPPQTKTSAASATANHSNDNDDGVQLRGRTRSTRSSTATLSMMEPQPRKVAKISRDATLDGSATEDAIASGNNIEDEDTGSSVEVGRRAMETPAQRRDTTGLDLADDSVFGDLDDSFEGGDIPDAARSADGTSLSLRSFKPRSRQSSIIGRNDPPIRPSSRGGNTPSISSTFNIGMFRRRAREPSILGTSRKPHPDTTATTATAQSSDLESEDDFAPEAVSTPLNKHRRTQPSREAESAAQRDDSNRPVTRKRKSEEAPVENERPEKTARTGRSPSLDDDSDSDLSSLPSPQQRTSGMPPRPVTPMRLDEIVAPPASSGSEDEGDLWPDIHALAKRRRRQSFDTPVRAGNVSDASSPPSLTHSPNFANAQGDNAHEKHSKPSPKLMTADLAGLLPKRRYKKRRDSVELESEDEMETRQPTRTGSLRSASRNGPASNAGNHSKQGSTPNRRTTRARAQARKSSDKENESEEDDAEEESGFVPMPDDTFEASAMKITEPISSEELRKASSKFQEVDRWELDYEEVLQSSPVGAR